MYDYLYDVTIFQSPFSHQMMSGQISMLNNGPFAIFYGGQEILGLLAGEPGRWQKSSFSLISIWLSRSSTSVSSLFITVTFHTAEKIMIIHIRLKI